MAFTSPLGFSGILQPKHAEEVENFKTEQAKAKVNVERGYRTSLITLHLG